jgi:hypothetical protein
MSLSSRTVLAVKARQACNDNKKPPKFGNNTGSLAARPAYKAATVSLSHEAPGETAFASISFVALRPPGFPGFALSKGHSVLFDSLEFITALPSCQERRKKCFGS